MVEKNRPSFVLSDLDIWNYFSIAFAIGLGMAIWFNMESGQKL